jgi:hypothetical protein
MTKSDIDFNLDLYINLSNEVAEYDDKSLIEFIDTYSKYVTPSNDYQNRTRSHNKYMSIIRAMKDYDYFLDNVNETDPYFNYYFNYNEWVILWVYKYHEWDSFLLYVKDISKYEFKSFLQTIDIEEFKPKWLNTESFPIYNDIYIDYLLTNKLLKVEEVEPYLEKFKTDDEDAKAGNEDMINYILNKIYDDSDKWLELCQKYEVELTFNDFEDNVNIVWNNGEKIAKMIQSKSGKLTDIENAILVKNGLLSRDEFLKGLGLKEFEGFLCDIENGPNELGELFKTTIHFEDISDDIYYDWYKYDLDDILNTFNNEYLIKFAKLLEQYGFTDWENVPVNELAEKIQEFIENNEEKDIEQYLNDSYNDCMRDSVESQYFENNAEKLMDMYYSAFPETEKNKFAYWRWSTNDRGKEIIYIRYNDNLIDWFLGLDDIDSFIHYYGTEFSYSNIISYYADDNYKLDNWDGGSYGIDGDVTSENLWERITDYI